MHERWGYALTVRISGPRRGLRAACRYRVCDDTVSAGLGETATAIESRRRTGDSGTYRHVPVRHDMGVAA